MGFCKFDQQMTKHYEWRMHETQVNLPLALRHCNHWKNLFTVPLQALPFLLDAEVYPVLQAVDMANVVQPEGVALYIETTEKRKRSVHHFVYK